MLRIGDLRGLLPSQSQPHCTQLRPCYLHESSVPLPARSSTCCSFAFLDPPPTPECGGCNTVRLSHCSYFFIPTLNLLHMCALGHVTLYHFPLGSGVFIPPPHRTLDWTTALFKQWHVDGCKWQGACGPRSMPPTPLSCAVGGLHLPRRR